MRKPLAVAEGMGNIYPETNITYSPDGKSILTGLPGKKGMKGSIVFLSAEDLSEQRRIPIGEGTVVRVLWHSKINQVSYFIASLYAMLITGIRNIVHRSDTCLILASLVDSRCPSPTKEDAKNSASRSLILHCRPQASHLHSRCSSSIRRSRSSRVITSKRQEGEETQAYRANTWSWKRWSFGSVCYSGIGAGYIHEREIKRGCESSLPGHTV